MPLTLSPMPRLLALMLLALTCSVSACRPDAAEEPEPTGPLEGRWRVGLTDIVEYDRQDRATRTWLNQANPMNYSHLAFTPTDVVETVPGSTFPTVAPYIRAGNEITCAPPMRSYSIRRITARQLDLYLRGEYPASNSSLDTRFDFTIHFERE